ncbi:MAG: tetratricopeptide repeat protein [Acidobacteria bacterium]|nr:tetratricopeptide repeat protein [Acidobacteriota bacterium]
MPGGSLPARELRFTLTREDGRIETLFTDTKGKYQLSGDLLRERSYTVTVRGDGRTFDTTTASLRIVRGGGTTYTPVFLRAPRAESLPPAEVVDVGAFDAGAPAEARASYERGMEAARAGDAAAALQSLKRAVGLYPNYLRAHNDLGVLYLKLDRLEEAAEAFRRAMKISRRYAYPRLNLGVALNRLSRHKEAEEILEPLHKDNPSLAGVRVAYADALYGRGRLAEARKILQAGLAEPKLERAERAELHYKLGRVLGREERVAESVAELQRSVEIEPDAANAQLLLGGGLLQLKRAVEAEKALRRAYELGGASLGHAQLMLGQLYFEQKKYEQALAAFEQYLKDLPQAPNAAQIKDVAAKLRESLRNK